MQSANNPVPSLVGTHNAAYRSAGERGGGKGEGEGDVEKGQRMPRRGEGEIGARVGVMKACFKPGNWRET